MESVVEFYSVRDKKYGCFSNFSKHPFELDGKTWPTTEHYFQSKKFAGTEYERVIRKASSPTEAAKLGRSRKFPIREDWEQVKVSIMKKCVMKKFQTHKNIRKILIGTKDSLIVEKTTKDMYWGCGTNGKGKNKLGIILMEVRTEL